jgi:hypothetical protein
VGALRSYSGTSREVYHFQASKPQQPGVSIQKLAYDRSLDSDAAVRERMAGQELRVPPNYLMHLLAGYRAADEAGDDVVKAVCYGLVRQELKVGVRALAPRSMALHAAFGLRDQRSRRAPKRLARRLSASRLQAVQKCLGTKGFSGYHGCTLCYQRGAMIEGAVRWVPEATRNRTDEEALYDAAALQYGFHGWSAFNTLIPPSRVACDELHLWDLGLGNDIIRGECFSLRSIVCTRPP